MFKIRQKAIIFSLAFLISCLCIPQIHAEDARIELKSEKIQLSNDASIIGDIKINQGEIEIKDSGVQGSSEITLEQGTQPGTSSVELQRQENIIPLNPPLAKGDQGGLLEKVPSVGSSEKKVKTAPASNYKGVSISNTSGKTISTSLKDTNRKDMKKVVNLGKSRGEIAKAQSIKSQLKEGESPELKSIEEKRLKRKEAFKKELENKEARKALINRQGNKEK